MAISRQYGGERRGRRRWSFGGCVFDEANWSLFVEGKRVMIESKPLELLRELLLHPGQVVSKEELLDTIWPDVMVVEASLPTAVRKLRLALGDTVRDHALIETVSGIGYRLAVAVDREELTLVPAIPHGARAEGVDARGRSRPPVRAIGLVLLTGAMMSAAALVFVGGWSTPAGYVSLNATQHKQLDALRKLDIASVEGLLAAGWDVNRPYDSDGNGALNMLLNNCEWDPGHDQRKLLLIARTLIDGGAALDRRNAWGDTPYSIASAKRYCGPGHPVTKMIKTMCDAASPPLGDRCLADYHRDASGKVLRQ